MWFIKSELNYIICPIETPNSKHNSLLMKKNHLWILTHFIIFLLLIFNCIIKDGNDIVVT